MARVVFKFRKIYNKAATIVSVIGPRGNKWRRVWAVAVVVGILYCSWLIQTYGTVYKTDHSMMNHSMHHAMNHTMDHSTMDHSKMDHSNMDHSDMDHSTMDHSAMDHGEMGMDHMMMMYFHFSTNSTILFKQWSTSSWQGMLGSCAAVFLMAALYEGLKVVREYLLRRSNVYERYHTMPVSSSEDTVINDPPKTITARLCSAGHAIQSVLHVVQIVISYFLMLIFMTYNVYLCIAVAAGAGTGYFLFSWKRAIVVDINEHCH